MPFIILFVNLCTTGWCISAQHIVSMKNQDECNAYIQKQYGPSKGGSFAACVLMPGWETPLNVNVH